MAIYSMDDLNVASETDLFFSISKSFSLENASSAVNERDYSWKDLIKIDLNNSKQVNSSSQENTSRNYYKNLPGAMPMSMNQILKAQNTNAPWLFNILKKKFHRSRKHKKDRLGSKETDSNKTMTNTSITLAEELLEKPISHDGTSGKWIVKENEIAFPLLKDFQAFTSGQYNISRAMSSSTAPIPLSTNDSLHIRHYQYDFQTSDAPLTSSTSFAVDDQLHLASILPEEKRSAEKDAPVDFTSIASMVKTYYTTSQQQINILHTQELEMPSLTSPLSLTSTLKPITEDLLLASGNSTTQTTSKRAKSTSAAAAAERSHRAVGSTSTKRGTKRSESTKKKKSKYYQEHLLTSEEIELREALRIIDLDNIGFFPPSELRKVLKEIGINSNDIDKIERCLPLDDDGHYSIDNLIKLFIGSKSQFRDVN